MYLSLSEDTNDAEVGEERADLLRQRGKARQEEDDFEGAVRDFQDVVTALPNDREAESQLADAKRALEISKKVNYYKVLEVSRDATDKEIKSAYRKKAREHHPDKAVGRGEDRETADARFRDIAAAYEVLSDADKRAIFDRGTDPLDPKENRGGGGRQQGNPFGQGGPFGGGGFNFQGGFEQRGGQFRYRD